MPIALSIVTACFGSCTRATNELAIRKSEAILIAPGIFELAPAIAIPLTRGTLVPSETSLTFTAEGGSTAALLPNGELLTVAHVFHSKTDPATESAKGVVFPFLVGPAPEFASVVASDRKDIANGDWALLSLAPSKNSSVQQLLSSPLRAKLRFDGSAFIPKGTPLYCIGFPRAPEVSMDLPEFGRALTVVQGRAERDCTPDEEILAMTDTELDMRGMSGGPVGTYNNLTGEFTIVGIAVRGTYGSRFLGRRFGQPLFLTSRIPLYVMQRLESQDEIETSSPDAQTTAATISN